MYIIHQESTEKLCTVSSYTQVGSSANTVHRGLQSYAYEFWLGIGLSSYLAWIYYGSYMHCNHLYQY